MKPALFVLLLCLSLALTGIGAIVAFWLTHEYFGYHGNRSVTFYVAGAFLGYLVTEPGWRWYRRRYPR